MRVLVILGHPRNPSLCASLAEAYVDGARAADMEVKELDLGALDFDPDVHPVSPRAQPLEADLERATALIAWAEHITFIYPAWWGVGPARLRGFLDRVLQPGFAFFEQENGRFTGLLNGRTAHLITTMDMPPAIYHLVYRAPGINAMKRSALGFCGIDTTAVLALGPVKDSTATRRAAWLERARGLGFSLGSGARRPAARAASRLLAWVKALRLQFYPLTWIAYSVGALGAIGNERELDWAAYWVGYACTFFLEAATVFVNEYGDFESDRRNRNFGPFNGGSRVLVDELLSVGQLRTATVVALAAATACAGWLLDRDGVQAAPLAILFGLMLVLGPGYTAPPLKLSWRGLGELDVALTHSFAVVVFGHLVQDGNWSDPFPWLVSVPLFLAVLPAIIMSGIPDADADRQAGKRTLAVRLGLDRATLLALGLALAAALAVILLKESAVVGDAFQGMLIWILPHALLLVILLYRDWQSRKAAGRINALMVAALSYIVWFALLPFLNLI